MPSRGAVARRRRVIVAVGFLLAGAMLAGSLAVLGGGSMTPRPSNVAAIRCTTTGTKVDTPVVRVQPDGLHVHVDGSGNATGLTVDIGGYRIAQGPEPARSYPVDLVLPVSVGEGRIVCGYRQTADGPASKPIEVVDPSGLWHDPALDCGVPDDVDDPPRFSFWTVPNRFPDVLERVVPGIRRGDDLVYAGYPRGEFGRSWLIRRGGDTVSSLEVSTHDDRSFVTLWACDGSGIGASSSGTAGRQATPFEVDGFARCDPYRSACSDVFVTAAWYADARGEPLTRYAYREEPSAACLPDQPQGCRPDPEDVVLVMLMSPDDAVSFVATRGCGTEAAICGPM